jgi:hypothetical protein
VLFLYDLRIVDDGRDILIVINRLLFLQLHLQSEELVDPLYERSIASACTEAFMVIGGLTLRLMSFPSSQHLLRRFIEDL